GYYRPRRQQLWQSQLHTQHRKRDPICVETLFLSTAFMSAVRCLWLAAPCNCRKHEAPLASLNLPRSSISERVATVGGFANRGLCRGFCEPTVNSQTESTVATRPGGGPLVASLLLLG